MWTFIFILLALGINFYIPETNKLIIVDKKDYQRLGFPYQYFEGEFLSKAEAQRRLCLIFLYSMVGASSSLPLAPSVAVVLPLASSKPSIERV